MTKAALAFIPVIPVSQRETNGWKWPAFMLSRFHMRLLEGCTLETQL